MGWFQNPNSGASSDYIVDGRGTNRIAIFNNAQYITWHAGSWNTHFQGIEVSQSQAQEPYTEWQYLAVAKIVKDEQAKWGFDITPQTVLGHEDTAQGKSVGKTDPGPRWDWTHFRSLL